MENIKKLCECGCGQEVNPGRRYIYTHNRKNKGGIILKCANCGNLFKVHPSRSSRETCSKKCYFEYKPGIIKHAENRKNTFLRKYGGFEYIKVHGEKKALELLNKFSIIRKETHKNRSPEKKKEISEKVSKSLMGHLVSEKSKLKMLESTAKANLRPNKFEIAVGSTLEGFRYVGDRTFIINGHSPDFVNEKEKTVVLANGWYWHLKKKGLEVTDENKRLVESIEAKPYEEVGYKVIFIWEDEFNITKNSTRSPSECNI